MLFTCISKKFLLQTWYKNLIIVIGWLHLVWCLCNMFCIFITLHIMADFKNWWWRWIPSYWLWDWTKRQTKENSKDNDHTMHWGLSDAVVWSMWRKITIWCTSHDTLQGHRSKIQGQKVTVIWEMVSGNDSGWMSLSFYWLIPSGSHGKELCCLCAVVTFPHIRIRRGCITSRVSYKVSRTSNVSGRCSFVTWCLTVCSVVTRLRWSTVLMFASSIACYFCVFVTSCYHFMYLHEIWT